MKSKNLTKLVSVFAQIQTKKEMENLLSGLFTPQEIEELGRRIEIVKMLKKGISQHEIAAKLGVGVATVTRGSRELHLGRFKTV